MNPEFIRVAASFGVYNTTSFKELPAATRADEYEFEISSTLKASAMIDRITNDIYYIQVGDEEDFCKAHIGKHPHCAIGAGKICFYPYLAKALYCLGYVEISSTPVLPSFSFHEKLELRLSMPREFWPSSWENS